MIDSLMNFRKYSSVYSFYFYRKNFIRKESKIKCLVIGLTRLYYFFLIEFFYYIFFIFRKKIKSNSKVCVLIGSENNYKAYLIIRKYLSSHDTYGFHTWSKNVNTRINMFNTYLSGLKSIKDAIYYSFIRDGMLSNVVLKRLDWFVLSNGDDLCHSNKLGEYKQVVYFSEYSVYIKKALIIFNQPKNTLIYFPHADMPAFHPKFWADIVFSTEKKHVKCIKHSAFFYYIPKIDFNNLNGVSIDGIKFSRYLGDKRIQLLFCTNQLTSLYDDINCIKDIKHEFSKIKNMKYLITVRPHPSEKFIFFKKIFYGLFMSINLDTSNLIPLLLRIDIVYSGISGVLFEAQKTFVYVFTKTDLNEINSYYPSAYSSGINTYEDFISKINSNGFFEEVIENRRQSRDMKRFSDPLVDIDNVLSQLFRGFFYDKR